MKKTVSQKSRARVSSKLSVLDRLSAVESQNNSILELLHKLLYLVDRPTRSPFVSRQIIQDAIRAHISGDRKPMDALEHLWEYGAVDESVFTLQSVLSSQGGDHGL